MLAMFRKNCKNSLDWLFYTRSEMKKKTKWSGKFSQQLQLSTFIYIYSTFNEKNISQPWFHWTPRTNWKFSYFKLKTKFRSSVKLSRKYANLMCKLTYSSWTILKHSTAWIGRKFRPYPRKWATYTLWFGSKRIVWKQHVYSTNK